MEKGQREGKINILSFVAGSSLVMKMMRVLMVCGNTKETIKSLLTSYTVDTIRASSLLLPMCLNCRKTIPKMSLNLHNTKSVRHVTQGDFLPPVFPANSFVCLVFCC